MQDKITCPKCEHEFDVEQVLKSKLEIEFTKKYAEEWQKKKLQLEKDKQQLEIAKEKQDELLNDKLQYLLEAEKVKITKSTNEDVAAKMKVLEDENAKRKAENLSLKQKEVNLLEKEKSLKEKEEEMQLFIQKQMLEKEDAIKQKALQKANEGFELIKKEYQKKLDDQKKLTEEMKRKQEQGSMQLQGEVQELALEELLASKYPWDTITEVGKGIKGADCIQAVFNNIQQECGKIVYESKRTKTFSSDWIEKLKQDQVMAKADIAVLVTEVLPSDMNSFGEKDGVWICTFNDVSSLSFVLRTMLLKVQTVKSADENKGEKMVMLYKYLTGNEFSQNIKRIVENYDLMINQLNTEKKRTHKSWAEREKQIWVVQENLSTLFGSIKGIAGNSIETIDALSLSEPEIES